MPAAHALELHDIQGIILRGYERMEAAAFVLLAITNPAASKAWLRQLADAIRTAETRPEGDDESCLNLAFTRPGLDALGVPEAVLEGFSREFREGMTTEHRQRILGDHGPNAPAAWRWGGPDNPPVHLVLMLYARDGSALESLYGEHAARFAGAGLSLVERLDTQYLTGRKEHFGFRDGIAQPQIIGKVPDEPVTANHIAPGELLLGYPNEYQQLPASPALPAAADPDGLLASVPGDTAHRDLGRNGSYLVFRQLSQDVPAFWRFLDERTRDRDGAANPAERVKLAAKMVGRWPSGAPLVKAPDHDLPELADADAFGYHTTDPEGLACPVGSHIRRTNQRDEMTGDPDESVRLGNLHRIMRRGRAYGPPVDPSMDPDRLLQEAAPATERGLHFLCFNANIARQFEFMQHTWANNKHFEGLYNDADPLIGDRGPVDRGATSDFHVPAHPVRRRVTGLPGFVGTRGGAYFFMPGLRALRYLATV